MPDLTDEALTMASSYERLAVILDHYSAMRKKGTLEQWFRVLGENWSVCDNIGASLAKLSRILARHPAFWFVMMGPQDHATLAGLPDTVTIYRGCGPGNRKGLSWSTERDVAAQFPFKHRYKQTLPILRTAVVSKTQIVACFGDRQEHEVLVFVNDADIVSETTIATSPT